MSSTIAFASAKGNKPAKEPLPAMWKATWIVQHLRSTPAASSNFADMPVPALAPIIGNPLLDLVLCKVTVAKIVGNWLALSPPWKRTTSTPYYYGIW